MNERKCRDVGTVIALYRHKDNNLDTKAQAHINYRCFYFTSKENIFMNNENVFSIPSVERNGTTEFS